VHAVLNCTRVHPKCTPMGLCPHIYSMNLSCMRFYVLTAVKMWMLFFFLGSKAVCRPTCRWIPMFLS
jgi:hypothetical protein